MSSEPFQARPSGFIEFERVELSAVIHKTAVSHDDTMDSDPMSVNFGRKKDFKPAAAERMLAGATIDWLVAFPAEVRPKSLCDRFPHVANRLAKEWQDSERSTQSLRELAGDARWGSTGFPAQVQAELERMLQRLAPP